jgi:uncharacterized surface protein with fasciclin (FAS1) repeats
MNLKSIPAYLTLALLITNPAHAEELVITDFDRVKGPSWRSVNDRVMGGRSRGGPTVNDGVLTFKGDISLQNNGGFSSARTEKSRINLSKYEGLSLRIKPDARKYRLTIESQKTPRFFQLQYWADLKVKPGVWQTVRVPFKAFYPTSFGRRLPFPKLDRKSINAIGFMLYDKKAGPFELVCDSISAYNGTTPAKDGRSNTIVDVASKAGNFKTLIAAAKAAGLVPALNGPGPITVFAPTDAAFAKIPQEKIKALLLPKNRSALQAILKFHVVPGKVKLSDVLGGSSFATLNGQSLQVTVDNARLKIGGAYIVAADVNASNGIVHVIDTVLIPETRNIVDIANGAGKFKTLIAAAKAAGLVKLLTGNKPFTVFAPTDSAFAKLPKGLVKSLLEPRNKAALVKLLTHHVVPGRIDAAAAVKAGKAKSAAGTTLTFSLAGGKVQANGTNLAATDVQASNGVIHIVSEVLVPKSFKAPAPKKRLVKNNPALCRFIEATISRGAPLFNEGNTEACRTLYENAARAMLALRSADLDPSLRSTLKNAIERSNDDSQAHAWRLRISLDKVWESSGGKATQ